MSNSNKIHDTLKSYFGYDAFRPGQREIIEDALLGKDVIALLPTGGGKSLCYQVPALSAEGVCIVVSPLIALMKDQVQALKNKGISAVALTSGMPYSDIDRVLDNVVYGEIKFLYLSPERLKSDLVQERIKRMQVNLVAIDEAHCVSQWGYDFRPPYLEIGEIREWIGDAPFMALTASATPKVVADLEDKLQLRSPRLHQKSFYRSNLDLKVEWTNRQEQQLHDHIRETRGSVIVYIRSRNGTTRIATRLMAMGISAAAYHAGLTREERDERQAQWMAGDIQVMVATNAFGMGIDKSNVRLVVHLELPDSLEAYYQEAGRAGRDGQKAAAIMILAPTASARLKERSEAQTPDLTYTRRVYTALANQLQIPIGSGEGTFTGLDMRRFTQKYDLHMQKSYAALLLLERYGLIRLSEGFKPRSLVHITLNSEDLYPFEVQNPRFAPLIRQMLRWYGGILSGPTQIDERALASSVQLVDSSVQKQLKALEGMGVLEYRPAAAGQGLEWTMARMESQYLAIKQSELRELQEQSEKRVRSMIYFAEHQRDCRFTMLLEYFGEEFGECGHCDNCLESAKKPVLPLDNAIKGVLEKPTSLEELEKKLKDYAVVDVRKMLSYLLDEGFICRNEDGLYFNC